MSESALERLKRLAAEKKAAPAPASEPVVQPAPVVETCAPAPAVTEPEPEPEPELPEEPIVPKSTHPIAMEMAELQHALETNLPGFANKLQEIHVKLRKDPAIVTLLSDEEIGVIVAGLEKHTHVQIVAPAAIKASKSRKKEPVSALDL